MLALVGSSWNVTEDHPFSALTLFVGQLEVSPACKKVCFSNPGSYLENRPVKINKLSTNDYLGEVFAT